MCDDLLDDHEWVSEFSLALQEKRALEALKFDSEVRCVVQWGMLWSSAPTSLNNDLLDDGEILKKYDETANWAFQSAFYSSLLEDEYSEILTRAMLEGMTESRKGEAGNREDDLICFLKLKTMRGTRRHLRLKRKMGRGEYFCLHLLR